MPNIKLRDDAPQLEVSVSIDGVGEGLFRRGEAQSVSDDFADALFDNANFVDENGRNPKFDVAPPAPAPSDPAPVVPAAKPIAKSAPSVAPGVTADLAQPDPDIPAKP